MAPNKSNLITFQMEITLEFGGGLELLFEGKKSLPVTVPEGTKTVGQVVDWISSSLLSGRAPAKREQLLEDGTVRAGVLVLVNNADWELEGGEACPIQKNDTITFLSTIHGG